MFPDGLFLQPDPSPDRTGHFFLCPISDMPMDKYRGLLAELALNCEGHKKYDDHAPKPTLLTVQLSQHDTRFILEALKMLEEKWQHVNLTTSDEDEQAEYGMEARLSTFTRPARLLKAKLLPPLVPPSLTFHANLIQRPLRQTGIINRASPFMTFQHQ